MTSQKEHPKLIMFSLTMTSRSPKACLADAFVRFQVEARERIVQGGSRWACHLRKKNQCLRVLQGCKLERPVASFADEVYSWIPMPHVFFSPGTKRDGRLVGAVGSLWLLD